MIKLQFAEGLGNKFIFINLIEQQNLDIENALRICASKHTYDQLIAIKDVIYNNVYIDIYNYDCSVAEVCGNAFRALAVYFKKHYDLDNINIINYLGNIFRAKFISFSDEPLKQQGFAKVFFPKIVSEKIELNVDLPDLNLYDLAKIDIGNPHLIQKVEDIDLDYLKRTGKKIIESGTFKEGINFSTVKIIGNSNIEIATFERGVGFTMACGSGALASHVVSYLKYKTSSLTEVQMPGGVLSVFWDGMNDPYISGLATLQNELL